jgi:PAS domain S-box-containing protein
MLPARAQIVMFWGPEFVALYNDAYAPTIGDKHPRALGRPASENWSELWSDLEPMLQRVLRTGETVSAKDRSFYIERHGYPENVYFDISYSPVRDEAGAVRGVFCIVNETTDRVVAQHARGVSEARLQAIVAQATTGIVLTDATGHFELVNACFCEMVGYDEDELLGTNIRDITHPDDLNIFDTLFRRMADSGERFVIEMRFCRKDCSSIWVSNAIGPIRDAADRIRQAGMVVMDIGGRKRAAEVERRLAAIIESSDDAILSTSLDMTVTSWNRGAERLYGYSADEAIGRPVTMLVPDDRDDEEARIIDRIRRGKRVDPHETKRQCKDGRVIDVSLTISPMYDEHGSIIGASKIARDITSRKQAERLQHVLIDEMKHRVKNILATVQAIARQTFRSGPNIDLATEAFDSRLLSLAGAHDLLTRERWDGAELSDVIAEALAPYPREHFAISGPPLRLTPRVVLAMSLALHELATNAAKYGALSDPQGRVAITWTVEASDPPHFGLRWEESDGPAVSHPDRKGFGTRLVENVLAAELNGSVRLCYEPKGLVCSVEAPLGGGWERT